MYSRYVSYSPPCIAIRIVFVTWCTLGVFVPALVYLHLCHDSCVTKVFWFLEADESSVEFNPNCPPSWLLLLFFIIQISTVWLLFKWNHRFFLQMRFLLWFCCETYIKNTVSYSDFDANNTRNNLLNQNKLKGIGIDWKELTVFLPINNNKHITGVPSTSAPDVDGVLYTFPF